MDKVILPKEVAEAIEYGRTLGWLDGNILARTSRKEWESIEMKPINDFITSDSRLMLFASALINGFEVEETPEEKIQKYYKEAIHRIGANAPNEAIMEAFGEGQMQAVHFVLDALGIEIDGIPLGYKHGKGANA